MGDGVALGGLEFTDDTGEMNEVIVNLDPGGPKTITLTDVGGERKGTATWEELGQPHNVKSVEFVAPGATKRLTATQPGAFILQAAGVRSSGNHVDTTGIERPPVPFSGPVLTYQDTTPAPAPAAMFRFTPDGGVPNVTQRQLNEGVLEHKDAPPDLYNVTRIEVTSPVEGSHTAPAGKLLTDMTAETSGQGGGASTAVSGGVVNPPPPRNISA